MSGNSMVSPTFYNRKPSERLLKVINFQPHISIGFKGGDVNLYGYVQNNPINLTDPDGLHSFPSTPPGTTCISTGTCHNTKKYFKLKIDVECKCQFKFGISYDGPVANVTIFDSENKETYSVKIENTVTLSLGPCNIKATLAPY